MLFWEGLEGEAKYSSASGLLILNCMWNQIISIGLTYINPSVRVNHVLPARGEKWEWRGGGSATAEAGGGALGFAAWTILDQLPVHPSHPLTSLPDRSLACPPAHSLAQLCVSERKTAGSLGTTEDGVLRCWKKLISKVRVARGIHEKDQSIETGSFFLLHAEDRQVTGSPLLSCIWFWKDVCSLISTCRGNSLIYWPCNTKAN